MIYATHNNYKTVQDLLYFDNDTLAEAFLLSLPAP